MIDPAFVRPRRLETVAEGVELEAQARWMARNGCRQLQGYRIARPMSAADLGAWLAGAVGGPARSADRSGTS